MLLTGNGIRLHGTANCSYTVALDGVEFPGASPSSDTTSLPLFFQDGLEAGAHTVNVAAFPDAEEQFVFDSAVITDTYGLGCAILCVNISAS